MKIITYPRSGANYLSSLIFAQTGQKIDFLHTTDKTNETIITIARDPFESIHSHVVMKKHYGISDGYNKLDNLQYMSTYKFLYNNANIVIDYKDLIASPDYVTEKVLNIIEFKKNLTNPFVLSDNPKTSYLVSSKSSKEYNNKHFDLSDIYDCYPLYNSLLSKKNI
jgi:hypothetical protein